MGIFTDIKQEKCKHENYGILLGELKQPIKKVCFDCKLRWTKPAIMKGVKELTNA